MRGGGGGEIKNTPSALPTSPFLPTRPRQRHRLLHRHRGQLVRHLLSQRVRRVVVARAREGGRALGHGADAFDLGRRGGGGVFESPCERAWVAGASGGRWLWCGGFWAPGWRRFRSADPRRPSASTNRLPLLSHLGEQLLADLDAQAIVQQGAEELRREGRGVAKNGEMFAVERRGPRRCHVTDSIHLPPALTLQSSSSGAIG